MAEASSRFVHDVVALDYPAAEAVAASTTSCRLRTKKNRLTPKSPLE